HGGVRPSEKVPVAISDNPPAGRAGAEVALVGAAAPPPALLDSARTGTVRLIGMKDLLAAAGQIAPSTEPWFASARNVAMYANDGGMYDDLVAYLKKKRKL
ncbi:ATP-binding protein, partial [Streptomyces libani]